MSAPPHWSDVRAPTLDDIERLAIAAWNRLPDYVRKTCGDVVIRIDEFATHEVLDGLGIDSPFELMGLYQGVSMDRRSTGDLPREPDPAAVFG